MVHLVCLKMQLKWKNAFFMLNVVICIFIFCGLIRDFRITMPTSSLFHHVTMQHVTYENNGTTSTILTSNFMEFHQEQTYKLLTRRICLWQEWKGVLSPCKSNLNWTQRSKRDSPDETSARLSTIELFLRPVGYPSVVLIRTKNEGGVVKTHGGDFWDVKITGSPEIMIDVSMKDNDDGTYTGYFLLEMSGTYNVTCTLESSLCNGLRDPPDFWFIKGTVQGKFQRDGIIGACNDFLHEKATVVTFSATNSEQSPTEGYLQYLKNMDLQSRPFNRFCGYWLNGTFRSYIEEQFPTVKNRNKFISKIDDENEDGSASKTSNIGNISNKNITDRRFYTLKIYGDSMGRRFHESLSKNHSICTGLFQRCSLSYTWVYKFHDEKIDKYTGVHQYDSKDFNQTKYLLDLKEDLVVENMLNPKSAYVLNIGIHAVMTLPLETLMALFEAVVDLIKTLKMEYGEDNFPRVVWKTTTPPSLENFLPEPTTQLRFLTKHRVFFWNTYTVWSALHHGIPILDVYKMAVSYPSGPYDIVHYYYHVFGMAEDDLMMYLLENRK